MVCTLCICWYEDLIGNLFNNEQLAVEIFANHDLLRSVKYCPEHQLDEKCNYDSATYTFHCLYCDYKISQFEDTFIRCKYLCNSVPMLPSKYLRFINLFLQDFLSEKFALQNYHISKETFDRWLLFFLDVCSQWMRTQTPIGGNLVDVEIETRSLGLKEDHGESPVIWVLKATEKDRTNDDEGVVTIRIPNASAATIIGQIGIFIRRGSNLCFSEKDTHDVLKNSIYSSSLSVHYKLSYESPTASKHSKMQSLCSQFWEDLDSFVSLSEKRKECLQEQFARYIFLSRYSQKGTVLHHFLRTIASIYPLKPSSLNH